MNVLSIRHLKTAKVSDTVMVLIPHVNRECAEFTKMKTVVSQVEESKTHKLGMKQTSEEALHKKSVLTL